MYDKQKINKLFVEYCETGDDSVLEELMVACGRLINIIVAAKYPQFNNCRDDLRQEVYIKMIERFRDPWKRENLKKQYGNPVVFLYMWFWNCVFRAMKRYAKTMSLPSSLTDFEEQILNMHGREKLSFKEISEKLGASEDEVEGCYYIGKAKKYSFIAPSDNFEELINRSSGDLIDPSKQYELKILKKEFQEKIKNMADHHPVYSKDKVLKAKFVEEVTSLFNEEVGGEEENG